MSTTFSRVYSLPLVFTRNSVDGKFWNPTLENDRFKVIVVEFTLFSRRAPKSVKT